MVTAFQHLILREFGGTKAVTHGSQFQYGDQFHDQVSPYLGIALLKGERWQLFFFNSIAIFRNIILLIDICIF